MSPEKTRPEGFIVDEMLIKLGRFLRIAGYHVEIPRPADDVELLLLSRNNNLTLLTRDKELVTRKGGDSVLIRSDKIGEQVLELAINGKLEFIPRNGSNCPNCGDRLTVINRDTEEWKEIELNVPVGSRKRYDTYYYCTQCSKVYWKGSHWVKIVSILDPAGICPDLG
jgi:uncharacterized protein with PIN domain